MIYGTVTITGKIDGKAVQRLANMPAVVRIASSKGNTTTFAVTAGTPREVYVTINYILAGIAHQRWGFNRTLENILGTNPQTISANAPEWARATNAIFAHGAKAVLG